MNRSFPNISPKYGFFIQASSLLPSQDPPPSLTCGSTEFVYDATPVSEWHGSTLVAVGGVLTEIGRRIYLAGIENCGDL